MAQLGRNDPCPCGSEKKYKKCCLARHDALLTKEGLRLRDLTLDLIARLHDFTDENLTRAELTAARVAFLGTNEDPLLDADADMRAEEDGGDHGGRFVLDWLIFDRRENASGPRPTFLERFLAAEGHPAGASASGGLTQEQRDLLTAWQASYRGVFEVRAVFPGVSLVLEDIYTEEAVEVADVWVSGRLDLQPGDLLYARPLRAKPFDRLAPGALLLNPWWLSRFDDWYDEAADRVVQDDHQAEPLAGHIALMNAEAHSLHRLVLDLLFHRPEDDFDEELDEEIDDDDDEELDDDLDDTLARELFGDDDVGKGPGADRSKGDGSGTDDTKVTVGDGDGGASDTGGGAPGPLGDKGRPDGHRPAGPRDPDMEG